MSYSWYEPIIWIAGYAIGVLTYIACLEWITPEFPQHSMIGWYILLAGMLALTLWGALFGIIFLIGSLINRRKEKQND